MGPRKRSKNPRQQLDGINVGMEEESVEDKK